MLKCFVCMCVCVCVCVSPLIRWPTAELFFRKRAYGAERTRPQVLYRISISTVIKGVHIFNTGAFVVMPSPWQADWGEKKKKKKQRTKAPISQKRKYLNFKECILARDNHYLYLPSLIQSSQSGFLQQQLYLSNVSIKGGYVHTVCCTRQHNRTFQPIPPY